MMVNEMYTIKPEGYTNHTIACGSMSKEQGDYILSHITEDEYNLFTEGTKTFCLDIAEDPQSLNINDDCVHATFLLLGGETYKYAMSPSFIKYMVQKEIGRL